MTDEERQIRTLRQYLRNLTRDVGYCLDALANEMRTPSTVERGKRIAAICNKLNLSNDSAKRYGLGLSKR